MADFKMFSLGWRRRSAMIMDAAGCSWWLIKYRCPMNNPGWGTLLYKLTEHMGFVDMWDDEDD